MSGTVAGFFAYFVVSATTRYRDPVRAPLGTFPGAGIEPWAESDGLDSMTSKDQDLARRS